MTKIITEKMSELAARKPVVEDFTLVIFGVTGDLTQRKLFPAIYSLFAAGLLPEGFRLIGFARRDKTDESFRSEMRESTQKFRKTPIDDKVWDEFASRLFYHKGDLETTEDYVALRRRMEEDEKKRGVPGNHLFYVAAQPVYFVTICDRLRRSGLAQPHVGGKPWSRVIIEKPFGVDLAGARQLNDCFLSSFDEKQIYRIDHYLGKETVQNILVLRFANSIFEPIWNQKYLDHVQITVAEALGTEGRGVYYEKAGAIRDMLQNHMMHLLCFVAMDPPVSLDADSIRNEKVKVLKALRPIPLQCVGDDVVRGQYARGTIAGKEVPGYHEEEGVDPHSATETFVALRAFIDNWRWSGVPFYLRTGKRLPQRITEIAIHFKSVPQVLFNRPPIGPMEPNVLILRIQPNEGISMQFQVKVPGLGMQIRPLKMEFGYAEAFGREPPEAYERLLLEAALGDSTLFTRADEVEAAWAFVAPVLEGCARLGCPLLPQYPAGSWGPPQADRLINEEGRRWRR